MDITIHIPENCERYAADIKRFADAMLWKLRKNAYKGRWEDLAVGDVYQLMCGEAEELRAEIERPANAFDIVFEAADVANYALIIASMAVEKSSTFTEVPIIERALLVSEAYSRLTSSELNDMAQRKAAEHDDDIPF